LGQNLDHPLEMWSDDQLLDQYRYQTADPSVSEDRLDVTALTNEIKRRGLSFPDDADGEPAT
jgi:hypothetical protein